MKRLSFLVAVLFLSQFASAKDHTVVVKSDMGHSKGNTEVFVHEGEDSDTLTVTPGVGVTTITVTVHDLEGVLLQQDVLSAAGDHTSISTPPTSNGCILTLRDDKGVVYTEYEE